MEGTKIEYTGVDGCECPWSSESASYPLIRKVIEYYKDVALKLGLDNTPLVDLSYLSSNRQVRILAKDESQNVTGSVKVRAALFNMAEFLGDNDKKHFLDASSGNYAKALVYLASRLGYESTLFVPENVSAELQKYISAQGLNASLFFEGIRNSDEARERACEYAKKHPELIFLDQYKNDGTWLCHYHFTVKEILSQLGKLGLTLTHFISGVGSGGTVIGVGEGLKESGNVEIIGLESRVSHSIRGIRSLKTMIPEVYSHLSHIVDRIESVDPEEIVKFKDTLKHPFGVSAYANIYESRQLSKKLEKGVIVTIIPDGGLQ